MLFFHGDTMIMRWQNINIIWGYGVSTYTKHNGDIIWRWDMADFSSGVCVAAQIIWQLVAGSTIPKNNNHLHPISECFIGGVASGNLT